MSTLSHARKRLKHYLDPRTAFKATVHATQRAVHYADPRVHIRQAERAAHQVSRTAKEAGGFVERQARKDYIKFNRINSYIAPVVTPVLAFVAELVPVFGLVLGPVISFAGAAIARVSTGVALRSKGVTGLENRQKSRAKQNRTLKYGLFGSAAGGLASAFGLSLTASEAAISAPANATSGAPAAQAGSPAVANAAAASGSTASTSTGILGTGITWSQIGSVLAPVLSIAPNLMKALGIGQPKPAGQAGPGVASGLGEGGGAGGTEGTGNVGAEGPLGALADNLAGLPLPIKLGAAALGIGAVALAFKKGKLA